MGRLSLGGGWRSRFVEVGLGWRCGGGEQPVTEGLISLLVTSLDAPGGPGRLHQHHQAAAAMLMEPGVRLVLLL